MLEGRSPSTIQGTSGFRRRVDVGVTSGPALGACVRKSRLYSVQVWNSGASRPPTSRLPPGHVQQLPRNPYTIPAQHQAMCVGWAKKLVPQARRLQSNRHGRRVSLSLSRSPRRAAPAYGQALPCHGSWWSDETAAGYVRMCGTVLQNIRSLLACSVGCPRLPGPARIGRTDSVRGWSSRRRANSLILSITACGDVTVSPTLPLDGRVAPERTQHR